MAMIKVTIVLEGDDGTSVRDKSFYILQRKKRKCAASASRAQAGGQILNKPNQLFYDNC